MSADKPIVLIMAGGSGTRFWPYSREQYPKQFLDILGMGETLIQATFRRFLEITDKDRIFVATNAKYQKLVKKQLPGIAPQQIFLEPEKKNTAPCIAYASIIARHLFGDPVMIVTPSDHVIFKEKTFLKRVMQGVKFSSRNDSLLTIGIKPVRPETGYGYIRFEKSRSPVKKVKAFVEKPSRKKAVNYLKAGNYLWNAGIFIWKNSSIRESMQLHVPGLLRDFAEVEKELNKSQRVRNSMKKAFSKCDDISIDYAVMEKAKNVYVIPGDFGWSDLGSWNAVHDLSKKDKKGNVILTNAIVENSSDCIIVGEEDKLVIVDGLKNYLVANFGNGLLICRKDDEKKIREFVKRIANEKGKAFT